MGPGSSVSGADASFTGLRSFAEVGEGGPLRFDTDPDLTVEDASAEYRAASQRLLRAFGRPGVLERTFAMPWGDSTGYQLAGFELIARGCGSSSPTS
jgi:hypothetical protein